MGVALRDIIAEYKVPVTWEALPGIAAIDANNALYQFLTIIRQPDGTPVELVVHGDEVCPCLMSEEKRIEIWQKTDQGPFELGLCQCVEVSSKDRRLPALDTDGREISFLATPDLASPRERDAGPQRKVGSRRGPKRSQV